MLNRRLSGLKQVAKSITTSEHPELVPSGAVPQNPSSHDQLDSQILFVLSITLCHEVSLGGPVGAKVAFFFQKMSGGHCKTHIIPGTKDDMRVMD